MASKVVGFAIYLLGDGTTNPVTIDLRNDGYFLFSPFPVAQLTDTITATDLLNNVAPVFDVLKTPPSGFTLGSLFVSSGVVEFGVGDVRFTASLSGYILTITPTSAFTSVLAAVGLLGY